jgi:hypothetical protein
MTDVTDYHRAMAAAVVLARAEHALGLPIDAGDGLTTRCSRILAAAQHRPLDMRAYRLAWMLTRGRRADG